MIVSVEISYYPLTSSFDEPIKSFIQKLKNEDITVEIGQMSTLITGDYQKIMKLLTNTMGDSMETYPSVFNIKISNSCIIS